MPTERTTSRRRTSVDETPATTTTTKTPATTSFFDEGVELEHTWQSTGRVRQGKYGLQVAFIMKNSKTRIFSLSQYCEQFTPGTVLRPSSIVIEELYDEEEERYIYRVSGEAM